MSTWPPFAIAGQPSACAEWDRQTPARTTSASLARRRRARPFQRTAEVYTRGVPEALYFTDSDEANEFIASDPLALLIGFAIDQQVTVQQAVPGAAPAEAADRHARRRRHRRDGSGEPRGRVPRAACDPPLPAGDGKPRAGTVRGRRGGIRRSRRASGPRRPTRPTCASVSARSPGSGR